MSTDLQRTLVLVKPDGVSRGVVGEVLGRIERRGYHLVALELRDDGLAGCLRAVTGGSSKQLLVTAKPGRIVQMRYLSAREYARLQGVPESFWVPESVAGLHALGDAVAVPVLEWLGKTVTYAFANEPVLA